MKLYKNRSSYLCSSPDVLFHIIEHGYGYLPYHPPQMSYERQLLFFLRQLHYGHWEEDFG